MFLDLASAAHEQKATYTLSSLPPPYPSLAPLQSSSPLLPCDYFEEKGGAILPPYTNSIYLRAIMPRKMEFLTPDIPAKDRRWRRVLCELDGTVFRVYDCSRGWWEDTIGVGDASIHGSATYNPSGLGRMDLFEEETHVHSLLASLDGDIPTSTHNQSQEVVYSKMLPFGCQSLNTSTISWTTTSSSQSTPHSASLHSDIGVPTPSPSSLIKTYGLQQCRSGVAKYYPKRKNVIRIRMDGEQFLLQAVNVLELIQWIEGLQAATNIALDLDQRVMPQGPKYPRGTGQR